jgi:hypothetical protein
MLEYNAYGNVPAKRHVFPSHGVVDGRLNVAPKFGLCATSGVRGDVQHRHMAECGPSLEYERLADEHLRGAQPGSHPTTAEAWDAFVQTALVQPWLRAYRAATPWRADVMEIPQGALTYLFDAAPTMDGLDVGSDRVVAVWGRSRRSAGPRDRSRQAGFIPNPATWSQAGRDRGHFVAHAAGGGMDMNFFPQAAGLNRGTTRQGRVWKAMERYAIDHPGTPLFVRPVYDDGTWVPVCIDFGQLVDGRLRWERFSNRDSPGAA